MDACQIIRIPITLIVDLKIIFSIQGGEEMYRYPWGYDHLSNEKF